MNARMKVLNIAVAALFLVASSGCVVVSNGGNKPHNITFLWTFGGRTCGQVGGVTRVKVTIPGQSLENGGVYSCTSTGTDGITLLNFKQGAYTYTLSGQNDSGVELYASSGSLTLGNSDASLAVDLTPVAKVNLTVLWTFGGRHCADVPSVSKVTLDIAGVALANNGVFNCSPAGADGITLTNFAPGNYPFTIQATNSAGTLLYSASGTFVVLVTDVNAAVDLAPVAGQPAFAYVSWTFPANSLSSTPNCTQAGVTKVVVTVDNGQGQLFTCSDGLAGGSSPGVLVTSTAGNHTIDVAASDDNGFYYYRKVSALPPLFVGGSVAAQYALEWNVGSLPLRWTFNSGGVNRDCAYVGATQVKIDLKDSSGNYVYGTAGSTVPCSTSGVMGTAFPYLYPDTYQVYIQAVGSGSILYKSNLTSPPTVTVTAGAFPQVSSSTPEIVMQ